MDACVSLAIPNKNMNERNVMESRLHPLGLEAACTCACVPVWLLPALLQVSDVTALKRSHQHKLWNGSISIITGGMEGSFIDEMLTLHSSALRGSKSTNKREA